MLGITLTRVIHLHTMCHSTLPSFHNSHPSFYLFISGSQEFWQVPEGQVKQWWVQVFKICLNIKIWSLIICRKEVPMKVDHSDGWHVGEASLGWTPEWLFPSFASPTRGQKAHVSLGWAGPGHRLPTTGSVCVTWVNIPSRELPTLPQYTDLWPPVRCRGGAWMSAIPGPGGSWELLCTEQLSKAALGRKRVGISSFLKRDLFGTFLVVVVSSSFHCRGPGFNPGRRTRISQVTRRSQKKSGGPCCFVLKRIILCLKNKVVFSNLEFRIIQFITILRTHNMFPKNPCHGLLPAWEPEAGDLR